MVAPIITKRMADAIAGGAPLALLAIIDHPDGLVRYWTGVGDLEFDGETWTGVGKLGGIAPIGYSSDLAIQEVSLTLSGVPPDVSTWISSSVRNRTATAYLAALDSRNQVIKDPLLLLDMLMDFQTLSIDNNGSAQIVIKARSGFFTLERGLDEVHSPEDQKRNFPGDTGFDLLADLQKQNVIWTPS